MMMPVVMSYLFVIAVTWIVVKLLPDWLRDMNSTGYCATCGSTIQQVEACCERPSPPSSTGTNTCE